MLCGEQAGDLNGTTTVQAIVPLAVTQITWNGVPIEASRNAPGGNVFTASIAGANALQLPSLTNWKVSGR